LFLEAETSPGKFQGISSHTVRVERWLNEKENLELAKRKLPLLVDVDAFMRGNPHPRMYIK